MAKSVVIKISGDAKEYKSTLSTVTKENKKMGVSAVAMAGVATAAFTAIVAGVVKVTQAYAVQEQAEIRTRATLRATQYAAGLTADELFNMASALQEVTTFGDETIISGQNMLLTFKNIGEDTFPRATKAMLDMATAMGTDLKSTAIQLGKALNDPRAGLASLSRVGITFTEQQKEQIKVLQASGEMAQAQAIILKELESQFGGTAEAAAKGTGKFTQLGNVWGDIAEKLGKKLLPQTSLWSKIMLKLGKNIDTALADKPKVVGDMEKELSKLQIKLKQMENAPFQIFGRGQPIAPTKRAIALLEFEIRKEKSVLENAAEEKANISRLAREKELAVKEESLRRSLELSQAGFDAEKELIEVESGEITLELLQAQADKERAVKDKAKVADLASQGKHDKALALQSQIYSKAKLKTAKENEALAIKQQQDFFSVAMSLASSENKALAAIGKAAALTQLAIKTPEAVGNSYAFGTKIGGPIGGAILAGIASVAMAAQAAKIAGISGFEDGGVVGGFSGATAGGDNRVITARNGEMFLNGGQQKNLFDRIDNLGSSGAPSEGFTERVEFSFRDNMGEFIEMKILERRALGIGAV